MTLADQMAASLTRIKQVPTFSRYLIGQDFREKIDYLRFSREVLPIDSPFALWKRVLKSAELALLNESLKYGDQPLHTHLLLTLNFAVPLLQGTMGRLVAKLVPTKTKRFIDRFWYKIFHVINQQEEVFIYVIENIIPDYPSDLVQKLQVKSLRPETGWLRIQ
ncbi:MAG: hypothetical protein EU536_00930 [Promethearchaeota archaeon]|nr:MAG: hypothetical protein EU536_00930 [Candidatus Lokiarchaeota archaeon]